jgi:hypothetical protein
MLFASHCAKHFFLQKPFFNAKNSFLAPKMAQLQLATIFM